MNNVSLKWRLALVALAAIIIAIAVPNASADIIMIQNSTGCASGISGICPGGGPNPFSVTDVENGSETLLEPGLTPAATVGNSTAPTYILQNDTGSTTFTLTFVGTLANNASLFCQEQGGFAGDPCSITGSLGTVATNTAYGPPSGQTTPYNVDVTITFNNVPVGGTFDLSFASFAHAGTDTGSVVPTPEPSGGLLLGIGSLGVIGLGLLRLTRLT